MPYSFSRIRPDCEFSGHYGAAQLEEQLSEAGIPRGAALMVHSSVRAIGPVEGGAHTVIAALCRHLGDGLLVMPAYTRATVCNEHNVFDPFSEPSCSGILGEALLSFVPSSVRSLHPEYSVAVYGRDAKKFIEGEQFSSSPFPRSGCMGKLLDMDGYIMLAGVGFEKCAFIACAEEWNGIGGRLSAQETRYIADYSGNLLMSSVAHLSSVGEDIAKNYAKLRKPLEEIGEVSVFRFGDAECLLCRCSSLISIVSRLLLLCPELFENRRQISKKLFRSVIKEIRG